MKPWMLALVASRRELVTETFTSNATWIAPLGTSSLVSLVGEGQDGTPESTDTREASAQVDSVTGYSSGSGVTAGALSWGDFQADNTNAYNAINGGGSGKEAGVVYDGYPGTNTYNISLYDVVYSNAVAGTASIVTSEGWKTSGAVLAGDYGFSHISYTQTYTIAATTGADTVGFGKTFPGGVGGPASPVTYNNVAVTPGASYSLTIPSGGSITITYYK